MSILQKNMKIAIIHEMLVKLGGAERVLQELMILYPEADVYTLLYDEKKVGSDFPHERIHCTGAAQWLYSITKKARASLPLMTFSINSLDFSDYDLVISSSSGFAHGANLTRKQRGFKKPFHICYCHSPARYLWDWTHEIQAELGISNEKGRMKNEEGRKPSFVKIYFIGSLVRLLFRILRKIDLQASQSPDVYIANSREVQTRIERYYHRESLIIYPPVDVDKYKIQNTKYKLSEQNYYIITSALTPFKRLDIPIRVLSELGIPLKIIGSGNQGDELKKLAGSSVEFLGRISDEEVAKVYSHARGFLMPQKEDAGIAPIEAMAAGLPVFGQAAGGLLETSVDGITGRFFPEETDESFRQFFLLFHTEIQENVYDSRIISQHAEQFSGKVFQENMKIALRTYTESLK